jgi:hypothetical protein
MSSKTTNFNLHKIDLTDAPPDITVLNGNFDTIDTQLKRALDSTGAHASSHATGGSDPITPASIGAVRKSGDTMNGNLTLNGGRLFAKDTNATRSVGVLAYPTDQVDFQNRADDNNYCSIRLSQETANLGEEAFLCRMTNGTFKSYTLIHSGNITKYVGAVPASVE